jgi:hypothetical protein
MSLNKRAKKFLELAECLYQNDWVHFRLQDGGWTDELEGEEKVFGIFVRTMICNDSESKRFFDAIGGFNGVKSRFYSGFDVEVWLSKVLSDINMGSGKGSHRDNRHKPWTPRGIKGYLDLVGNSQLEFFSNISGYDELVNIIVSLYGCGPLTAFDFAKRLYESGIVPYLPDMFYLTGTGEINGMKTLFPSAKKGDLIKLGNLLVSHMIEEGIPEFVAHYGLEDLLCIYQKDNRYLEFLECNIKVVDYASTIAGKNCIKERGIKC